MIDERNIHGHYIFIYFIIDFGENHLLQMKNSVLSPNGKKVIASHFWFGRLFWFTFDNCKQLQRKNNERYTFKANHF